MIDPQLQANVWVRKLCKDSLVIVKLSDGDAYVKAMEKAVLTGSTVLIEDVHEDLDPGLDPILLKAIYVKDGMRIINFNDRDITYDDNFKLFVTTKMPNPHYLPEICIKMTIINFTVTQEGLEEQMLVDVVIQEKPEVES